MGRIVSTPCKATLAAAVTAAILLSGCTGASGPDPQDSPAPEQSLQTASEPGSPESADPNDVTPHAVGPALNFECADPIDTAADIDGLNISNPMAVPDVMALAVSADPETRVQWGGASYKGLKFAKVGLILKAGTPLTLEVPPQMRNHMKIGWSNSGYTLADSLAVPRLHQQCPRRQVACLSRRILA